MSKVVVSADGTPESRAAVRWCADHLGPDAVVVAVCGIEEPNLFGSVQMPGALFWCADSIEKEFREHWCQPLRRAGLRCEYRFVHCAQALALREISAQEQPDALVVGKAPRRALTDTVLREPVHRLIHRPLCPVVVVPICGDGRHGAEPDTPESASATGACGSSPPLWSRREGESQCRLVLVSRAGDMLVLDALVTSSANGDQEGQGCLPVGLCVHLPSALGTAADVEATLRRWADTGATITVSFTTRQGLDLVQVGHDETQITLQLERPSRQP